MAYDEDLANRLRELLAARPDVTEARMFGGLAFLVGGNLAIAASGQGGLLVRVAPDEAERLVDTTPAEPAIMRGRPMTGWLRVAADEVRKSRALRTWADVGVRGALAAPVRKRRAR